MTKLKKAAAITDIHFGLKGNSDQHNQDCLNCLEWFCSNVKSDPEIDHIIFSGDWHDVRSSISLNTLNASYKGAKMLSAIGIPVYFIIGNHDLFNRSNREIHGVPHFEDLENFVIINEPQYRDEIFGKCAMMPFVFHDEYKTIGNDYPADVWWGHYEFKDFVITGETIRMTHGPDHTNYKDVKRIFSGHFHKRQITNNIAYIGNAFPMSFADAGDAERGMAIYDYESDKLSFKNWAAAPQYIKIKLSDLIEERVILPEGARVKCLIDEEVSDFNELTDHKKAALQEFGLRELIMEEKNEVETCEEDGIELSDDASLNEIVMELLGGIEVDSIDAEKLIQIYQGLSHD